MVYRTLGRTGLKVGEIGMGLEHLLDKDENTVTETIKAAADGGANYFDVHPGSSYNDLGHSDPYGGFEKFGKAIRGARNSFVLSYIAHNAGRTFETARPRFENYLRALKTDFADVFMIQFCDRADEYEQVTGGGGLLEFAKLMVAEGRARFIGISTHSTDISLNAIKNGNFDVIMFPVNPAFDAVTDGVRYDTGRIESLWEAADGFTETKKPAPRPRASVYAACERENIGLVAMKPFAGGAIFDWEKNAGFSVVNLMSYALNQTGISTVVPGCTGRAQIEQILSYYGSSATERGYAEAVSRSRWSVTGSCLYCAHCEPCANGIGIAHINRLIDAGTKKARDEYRALKVDASACTACGLCESRCPFGVEVANKMKLAAETLGKNKV
ncbi:MAG: aldo/keto reductase [Defluviitaleaceae bacterium]|nr:aldo/keto reductase [Defluviitaleaceae bacterium]